MTVPDSDISQDSETGLSPSAKALLQVLERIELGEETEVFQESPDTKRLSMMVSTFRGSISSALQRRLTGLAGIGRLSTITQNDLISLATELWTDNLSHLSGTEVAVLKAYSETPGLSLNDLAIKMGLSYPQVRRAYKRLRDSGVLQIRGLLNIDKYGMERMLLALKSPSLAISGPYVEKSFFVDGPSPSVYLVAAHPTERKEELLQLVRTLRTAPEGVSLWHLSSGKVGFSDTYLDSRRGLWRLDLLRFRLACRGGGDNIVLGESSSPSTGAPNPTPAELPIIDQLRIDYECTAAEVVNSTGVSESTAFRKCRELKDSGVVQPRTIIAIPNLTEHVLAIVSPNAAGDVVRAWQELPVTYITKIWNIEDPSENRILLIAALPKGTSRDIVNVLHSELSRADDYLAQIVSAGTESFVSTAAMFDRKSRSWRWSQGDFFDVRSYGIVRNEAETGIVPIDLA
jgi:DNA-binding Lrp family transcriptional regulator